MKIDGNLTLNIGGTIEVVFRPMEPEPEPPPAKGMWLLTAIIDGITVTGDAATMDSGIPEGKRGKYRITPYDVGGNPAPVDGDMVWTSLDETFLQVEADPASPNSCEAWVTNAPGGSLGPVGINVKADADMGEGMSPIEVTIQFTAAPGQAKTLGLDQVGELEDIPAAAPAP